MKGVKRAPKQPLRKSSQRIPQQKRFKKGTKRRSPNKRGVEERVRSSTVPPKRGGIAMVNMEEPVTVDGKQTFIFYDKEPIFGRGSGGGRRNTSAMLVKPVPSNMSDDTVTSNSVSFNHEAKPLTAGKDNRRNSLSLGGSKPLPVSGVTNYRHSLSLTLGKSLRVTGNDDTKNCVPVNVKALPVRPPKPDLKEDTHSVPGRPPKPALNEDPKSVPVTLIKSTQKEDDEGEEVLVRAVYVEEDSLSKITDVSVAAPLRSVTRARRSRRNTAPPSRRKLAADGTRVESNAGPVLVTDEELMEREGRVVLKGGCKSANRSPLRASRTGGMPMMPMFDPLVARNKLSASRTGVK